jgi:hypothetical protein
MNVLYIYINQLTIEYFPLFVIQVTKLISLSILVLIALILLSKYKLIDLISTCKIYVKKPILYNMFSS